MSTRSSAAALARATVDRAEPTAQNGALAMSAVIRQPSGEACRDSSGSDLTLGVYARLVLSTSTGIGGDTDEQIKQSVKRAILSQRISEAGEGVMRFTAEEVKIIRSCLAGQPPLLVSGLIRLIEPEYFERQK